jgi:hypothetical protein
MFRLDARLKVYLHREAVDGRKNINGLAMLVEQALGLDPFAAAVMCSAIGDGIASSYCSGTVPASGCC